MDFELTKEHKDIVNAAREFAVGEFTDRAQELDRNETFDPELWKKACELGFVGMYIPEEYGGSGMGLLECSLVMEEFWAVDAGIGAAVLAPVFGADIINLYGTEEQKKKYLSPIAEGQVIMGAAITEPDAGSDVTAATTTAIKDDEDYIINGSKMFITNGSIPKTPTGTGGTAGLLWKRTERDSRPISCTENSESAPAIPLSYPSPM